MKKNLTDLEKSLIKAGSEFDNVLGECILQLFDKAVRKNNVYVYNYSNLDSEVVRYLEFMPEESWLSEIDSDEIKWDIIINKNLKVVIFIERSTDHDEETAFVEGKLLEENIIGDDGQTYIALENDGVVKMSSVAYLVATAFVENPNGYKYLKHKDGDKSNNRAENLEWCETEVEYFETMPEE